MKYVLIVAVCLLAAGQVVLFDQNNQPADCTFDQAMQSLAVRMKIVEEQQSQECRAEQRVVDLPEDGNQWHTVLLLKQDWANSRAERRAESLFHSEPFFMSLKSQTHYHCYTEGTKEFEKFRPIVDATPCLLIERANGEVVYRESGPKLGKKPRDLTRAIHKEIQRHCPDGHCLPIHPVPNETPPANEIPTVLQDEPAPVEHKIPAGMAFAIPVGVGALALLGFTLASDFRRIKKARRTSR